MITIKDYEQAKENQAVTLRTIDNAAHDEIAAQIEAFMASGGKIQEVPQGKSALAKPLDRAGAKEYLSKKTYSTKDSKGREKNSWHEAGRKYLAAKEARTKNVTQ